jgi:predicted small lipoprotein YifL
MPKLTTTLIIAALLLLGGCGQMGPLYEPEAETTGSIHTQPDGQLPSSVA